VLPKETKLYMLNSNAPVFSTTPDAFCTIYKITRYSFYAYLAKFIKDYGLVPATLSAMEEEVWLPCTAIDEFLVEYLNSLV
jgi:hypothetical protein